MKRLALWLAALVLVLTAGAAALGWYANRTLDEPLALSAPVIYRIPPGASFARIASDLGQRKLIAHPRIWALYAAGPAWRPR